MKLFVIIIAALALSACSDPNDEDVQIDPVVPDCDTLTETECLAEPDCYAFYGKKVDKTKACFGAEEMIVCGSSAGAQCNNSIEGNVVGPDGTCWYQSGACFGDVPGYQSGIGACSEGTEACQPVDCGTLAETECLAEPECLAVYGHKIDKTAMCRSSVREMMACATLAAADCPNNAVGFAIDPDGTCWFQPSVCSNIGEGYVTNSGGTLTCPEVTEVCP